MRLGFGAARSIAFLRRASLSLHMVSDHVASRAVCARSARSLIIPVIFCRRNASPIDRLLRLSTSMMTTVVLTLAGTRCLSRNYRISSGSRAFARAATRVSRFAGVSSRRGRDDCGWRLRLRWVLLAPESGYVVLEVADGGVASRLGRHLTADAAVDRALPSLPQAGQVARVRGGLPGPRQRLGDVRQGLPAAELVAASALPGGTAAPFAQDVSQLCEARSSSTLVRRRGILGLVWRRDRCDLRRGVSSACSQSLFQSGLLHLLSHEIVPAIATLPYQPDLMT